MTARMYRDGFRCVECFVLYEDTDGKAWTKSMCRPCYSRYWRSQQPKVKKETYRRRIHTEDAYRKRIRNIAEEKVPNELRKKFLHTFLITHNPYKERSV
jgi:hypothetical protein